MTMAPPGRPLDRYPHSDNQSMQIYNGNSRYASQPSPRYSQHSQPLVQNGRHHTPQELQNGRHHSDPNAIYSTPHKRQNSSQGDYPVQAVVPYGQRPPQEREAHVNPKEQMNSRAVEKYQKKDKAVIRQGKHAAAVDQLFENDLHNVEPVVSRQISRRDQPSSVEVLPNGMLAEPQGASDPRYIKRYLNLQVHYNQNAPNVKEPQRRDSKSPAAHDPDSSLSTSFDPMRDRHMWTMWRTAVNGRIVDEVRKLEKIKSERGSEASVSLDSKAPGVYGRAIVAPPLKRFIRFDEQSKEMANQLSSVGQGRLQTDQFVYYGLPRVYVEPGRNPKI
ncbi:unnamed protein product [Lymnaea stagnalis]|uniref:Uncharacterized protein n=1 Tax=Lymnaea stagnalis TaxID=6523 RepID=A0AAV2I5F0_LYMST